MVELNYCNNSKKKKEKRRTRREKRRKEEKKGRKRKGKEGKREERFREKEYNRDDESSVGGVGRFFFKVREVCQKLGREPEFLVTGDL